jgi:hypothetical protein
MYRKNLLFLLLFISLSYALQNQNNISIEKNKVNIYGKFNGRLYENILLDNKTEITLYEKPDTDDGDPHLLQHTKSLIPKFDTLEVYIKQIQYVSPLAKELSTTKAVPLVYNKQRWYEVKITFSNDEVKNYLLPVLTTLTMTDKTLGMHSNMKISALVGQGIVIDGVRQELNKKKDK